MGTKPAIDKKSCNFPDLIRSLYGIHQETQDYDAFVNPVLRLSLDVGGMIQDGDITIKDLEDSIQGFMIDSLKTRAERLADYLNTCDEVANFRTLESLFYTLAHEGKKIVPFVKYKLLTEQFLYGFVFTAHPTFTMPLELAKALSGYAAKLAGAKESSSFEDLTNAAELRYSPPSIDDESSYSLEAIDNLHSAFIRMFEALFKVAMELYPDEWMELRPRICSIATWVGFDMDGRKDIQWAATLEKRITLQNCQLQDYKTTISSLLKSYPDQTQTLNPVFEKLCKTLEYMKGHCQFFKEYCQNDDSELSALQNESRALIKSSDERFLSASSIISAIETCLDSSEDIGLQSKLLVLLAQLHSFGLSRAQVHFRINANQIHNAISSNIELDTHPDQASHRRQYIDNIASMIEEVEFTNIDFGDIAEEDKTAKYEFMLIQQIVQYIDRESPIRFLIAETESAFTILAALYYAKMFGVSEYVDICPLFETRRALQDSSRYLQHLITLPVFEDYLNKRGRLCIQAGYSDAGRYIGQPAAGGSIERLKERIAGLFDEYKVKDISLLFFDTHGESVGRGGHPESFTERLRYVASPYFLHMLANQGIPYIQESSYQGGDGFIPFLSKSASLAVLTRVLEYMLSDHTADSLDPYYKEPYRSEVTQFFTEATAFQLSLNSSSNYTNLLSAFSTNMMFPSGSRAVKRSFKTEVSIERTEISQMRAIPHNAILAQFGLLSNTISGIGYAYREHSDFVKDMQNRSPRFRSIFSLIERAFTLSDPQIMKAYISLLDPTFWITRARHCEDLVRSNKFASIATNLESHNYHDGMLEIYRKLEWDHTILSHFLPSETNDISVNMSCLHAIRMALIHRIFHLATNIPRYGPHHPVSRDKLLQMIFQMDIGQACTILESIFPVRSGQKKDYDFGEISEYVHLNNTAGYTNIHSNIIAPISQYYNITQQISLALSNYMGFFG